jgi:hypothetical protein
VGIASSVEGDSHNEIKELKVDNHRVLIQELTAKETELELPAGDYEVEVLIYPNSTLVNDHYLYHGNTLSCQRSSHLD